MILSLYLVVLAFSIGLVNLAPAFELTTSVGNLNAKDLLLLVLLIVTTPGYLRERKQFVLIQARSLESAWIVLIIVLTLGSLNSPASSLRDRFVNLRFVEGFVLFFPTVALVTNLRRLKTICLWGLVFAVVGTGLTIAQTLHGSTSLFGSDFYDLGNWPGSKGVVGGFVRVNLPVSNWVAFTLIVLFAHNLLKWDWKAWILSGLMSMTIFLNFARSLWLGLFLAFVAIYFCLRRVRTVSPFSLYGLGLILAITALLYIAVEAFGAGNVTHAIVDRLDEGVFFFKHGTGTWGTRIIDTEMALRLWKENWLFGLGTNYHKAIGQYLDMGIAIVLVSVGAIGLVSLLWLFYKSWMIGIKTIDEGIELRLETEVVAGASLIGQIVLMIVYQQWLTPFVAPILALSGGVCVSCGTMVTKESD